MPRSSRRCYTCLRLNWAKTLAQIGLPPGFSGREAAERCERGGCKCLLFLLLLLQPAALCKLVEDLVHELRRQRRLCRTSDEHLNAFRIQNPHRMLRAIVHPPTLNHYGEATGAFASSFAVGWLGENSIFAISDRGSITNRRGRSLPGWMNA